MIHPMKGFIHKQAHRRRGYFLIALSAVAIAGMCQPARSATLCVNPGGTSGCFARIQVAILAASPYDTINVAAGTYTESVIIGKPLSLIGAGHSATVIDATGLPVAIFIDGIHNAGLNSVVVQGLTTANANFEGMLVASASNVTIFNNAVVNNNKSLNPITAECPGIPDFETAEGFDCGEGIHLMGVDHSTVANNIVTQNAGGILLSDETAPTHDNLITGNQVANNPYDCGITLASHPPASITGSSSPLGVFRNKIAVNKSINNGTAVPGAGAGVGMFTFLPGGTVTANVVIDNVVKGNGLPGVAIHGHSPGEFLNNNAIVGNWISANGADTKDAATPGPTGINVFGVTPINGTEISQNVIYAETNDIVVNTPGYTLAHLNELPDAVGVNNLGTGLVDATENWWGCSGGPGTGCGNVSGSGVNSTPWLTQPFNPKRFFPTFAVLF